MGVKGRRQPNSLSWVLMAPAVALAVTGCAVASRGRGQPLPPPPQHVDVNMAEYTFSLVPPRRAGRVVFRVRNTGQEVHELVLVALPEDLPPLGQQLRSEARRSVRTIATLPPRRPGENGAFAANLGPGRYGVVCFLETSDGELHARKGMHAEFVISAERSPAGDPPTPRGAE